MNDTSPNKSLGQHWLNDKVILKQISDLAKIDQDVVVEIGPGLGTLTEFLLDNAKKVIAIEFDDNLAKQLPIKINNSKLEVKIDDVLKFNFEKLEPDYKVCANIPYYLTSNLIRIFTELNNKPKKAVLLVQKEVAERICAKPGNMGLLSVWAQMNYGCRLGPVVPADKFYPPPKVDSQVVILDRREDMAYEDAIKKDLTKVLKVGFSSKRKTLVNCLSSGYDIPKTEIQKILNMLSININARAQELTITDWINLTKKISNT